MERGCFFWLFVFLLIPCGVFGAVDLDIPFASEEVFVKEAPYRPKHQFGSACAMGDSFAVVTAVGTNKCSFYKRTEGMRWTLVTNYTATQVSNPFFGCAAAMDGVFAAVGACFMDVGGEAGAGVVRMFRKSETSDGWAPYADVWASDYSDGALFGISLAMESNRMVVGAYSDDPSGAAYVFEYDGTNWLQRQKIAYPGSDASSWFGGSVALNGKWLLIGAAMADVSGTVDAGAAFLYEYSGNSYQYVAQLNGNLEASALFGVSSDVFDSYAMIGAQGWSSNGAVYVFNLNDSDYSYDQRIELTTPSGEGNDSFAHAVAMDGELAVIGAPYYGADDYGKVFVYKRVGESYYDVRDISMYGLKTDSYMGRCVDIKQNHVVAGAPNAASGVWTAVGRAVFCDLAQTRKLPGLQASSSAGFSVAVNKRWMAYGAPWQDSSSKANVGAVYLCERNGRDWNIVDCLQRDASDQEANDLYGYSVAMSKRYLLIGSPYANRVSGADVGEVDVYYYTGESWTNLTTIPGSSSGLRFGKNVACSDSHAAMQWYHSASNVNTVMTFDISDPNDIQLGQLLGGQYGTNIDFGASIAIDGDYMVVGAKDDSDARGAVYFYRHNGSGWVQLERIVGSTVGDQLGVSVDIDGQWVAVGAPKVSGEGAVYLCKIAADDDIYTSAIFYSDDRESDADFGHSVAFADNGRRLLVGAYKQTDGGLTQAGRVFVYRKTGQTVPSWEFEYSICAPNDFQLAAYDLFGSSLAAFGNTAVIGASGDNNAAGVNAGSATVMELKPRVAPADFDSDGITDIGCYYPASGYWYVFQSGNHEFWTTAFGYAGTTPFVGDFDGDWKADFGCFDAASGNWFRYCSSAGFKVDNFGAGGTPFVGDFDGDGLSDMGCFDASSTAWLFVCSSDGQSTETFGVVGSEPVTGDFDGDGIDDYGTYYAPSGEWMISRSSEGVWNNHFGYSGTVPITGDFDGDGIGDFGCYYAPIGAWYVYRSSEGFWYNNFGYSGTVPVTGDFDGDGMGDFGCYYAPEGYWYVYKSADGFWVNRFGYAGTVPMN